MTREMTIGSLAEGFYSLMCEYDGQGSDQAGIADLLLKLGDTLYECFEGEKAIIDHIGGKYLVVKSTDFIFEIDVFKLTGLPEISGDMPVPEAAPEERTELDAWFDKSGDHIP